MWARAVFMAWALAFLIGCNSNSSQSETEYGTPFAVLGAMKLAEQEPNVNVGLRSYTNCDELTTDSDVTGSGGSTCQSQSRCKCAAVFELDQTLKN